MLDDLKWEPLEVRRRPDKLSMLYRMQHNLVDIPANRYLRRPDKLSMLYRMQHNLVDIPANRYLRRPDKLSMLYRMQHNLVDIPANRYLSPSDSRTRETIKFYQERIGHTTYSNSFLSRGQVAIQSCVCSLPGRIQVIPRGVTSSITCIREVTVNIF